MIKEIVYDPDVVVKYENLPLADSLQYLNSVLTLSSMPDNFTFVEDPNPPVTVLVLQKAPPISLEV